MCPDALNPEDSTAELEPGVTRHKDYLEIGYWRRPTRFRFLGYLASYALPAIFLVLLIGGSMGLDATVSMALFINLVQLPSIVLVYFLWKRYNVKKEMWERPVLLEPEKAVAELENALYLSKQQYLRLKYRNDVEEEFTGFPNFYKEIFQMVEGKGQIRVEQVWGQGCSVEIGPCVSGNERHLAGLRAFVDRQFRGVGKEEEKP